MATEDSRPSFGRGGSVVWGRATLRRAAECGDEELWSHFARGRLRAAVISLAGADSDRQPVRLATRVAALARLLKGIRYRDPTARASGTRPVKKQWC